MVNKSYRSVSPKTAVNIYTLDNRTGTIPNGGLDHQTLLNNKIRVWYHFLGSDERD